MTKIIQIILFVLVIVLFFLFFNNTLFKKEIISLNETNQSLENKFVNNQIKDLEYKADLGKDRKYVIKSKLSNIISKNGTEIIEMNGVKAYFINTKKVPITILSDKARFYSTTYFTNFIDNVKLKYLDNIIYSDNLNLNFDKNEILIFNNVKYIGNFGNITTDNIKIDLITKKIYIYMNDHKKEVIIKSNK